MVHAGQPTQQEPIELKELLLILLHYWQTILFFIILAVLTALIYLRGVKPTYEVNAILQVKDEGKSLSTALLGDAVSNLVGANSPAETEVELMKSRAILGQAIKNLNLDIGLKTDEDKFSSRLFHFNSYKTYYFRHNVAIYNANGHGFSIDQFEVPVTYRDRGINLSFLDNSHFQLALGNGEILKGEANKPLIKKIDGEQVVIQISHIQDVTGQDFILTKYNLQTAVNQINGKLSTNEAGKQTGIVNVSYQSTDKLIAKNTLNEILNVYIQENVASKMAETESTMFFVNKQLPELQKQLEASEERFNRFREKNGTIDVNQEAQLLLQQNVELETKRIELEQKRAELTTRYTSDYPLVKEVDQQIASLQVKSGEYTKRVGQLPEIQRHYLQLFRTMEINTALYTNLLNSYQQLKIAKASQLGNARIVDQAINPIYPVKPNRLITLATALFAGLVVGIGAALIRSLFNKGLKDSTRIEESTGLPVYAAIPHSALMARAQKTVAKTKMLPLLATQDNEDLSIESLRSVRTVLHFAEATAKNNVVMITGPAPGIGKSFISSNLAAILAQSGQNVVVVDADMRRGHMQLYFNQSNNKGLANYIADRQLSIDDVLNSTTVDGLSFISRGTTPANPSELLMSKRFNELLEQLSVRFDHVIIDTPPVLAVTDGVTISQQAGTILLIARYNLTSEKELNIAINRLEQAGQKVNGIILNGVRKQLGDPYSYQYNYAYKSKD